MDKPYLEIRTAAGRTQLVLGGKPVTFGRHATNAFVIADNMASRFHCVVETTPEGYLLRDLGASNGTLVNGRRVRSALLSPGDVVRIGNTEIVLVLPDAPPRKPQTEPLRAKSAPPHRVSAAAARSDLDPIPIDDADLGPLDLTDLEELARSPIQAADPGGEGMDVLSEADLVEEYVAPDAPPPAVASEDDYEHLLRSLADSMPDRSLHPSDVVLINPRGQPVGSGERGSRGTPARMSYLLRLLLLACLRGRATDLHLEPKGESYQIRMRVDGVMVDALRVQNDIGSRLAGVMKIASDIDPSQRNVVQEGHFSTRLPPKPGRGGGRVRRVDFRLSFAPSVHGQKLVLRILDPGQAPGSYAELHLAPSMEKEVKWAIEQDAGMVLVSGPTGSGKTSTLYALLRSLNLRERNVVTIEDPVEIELENATQLPVDDEKGSTFANLLRSVLRQDPDVILVGEVRDAETARIAMQAAITGHLVFSTVHTKDAVGTIFRLLDLGVEPYLLAQGLHVVIAQRLVRQLCPVCRSAQPITPEQSARMGPAGEGVTRTYVPIGCKKCLGTGYAGRRAFFEMLTVNDALREAISRSPTPKEINEAIAGVPFQRLAQAGFQLVAEGVAEFDEVERVVGR